MANNADITAMQHPALPNHAAVAVHRSALPGHAARGWVEVKSPEDKPSPAENNQPAKGDTPSKEDKS